MPRGNGGHDPQYLEIIRFSEILVFRWKIVGLSLLAKIKVLNSLGKII